MKLRIIPALAFTIALSGAALAQESDAGDRVMDSELKNCVSLIMVERTEVIDDRHLMFFLKNGEVLINELPNRCPSLEREERFMYRTSMNQLCSLDTITVLQDIGFGIGAGPSCGLGKFRPISPDAAQAMLKEKS